MSRLPVTVIVFALLAFCACRAKPNGSKSKKPKQVVPDVECDVRAGKINLQEFIVKCPARCKETRQKVYGTGMFASISSICNAAIHSGVITNSGGKVIVKKMAGQDAYKGSNSNGVRSLSLPKWRESFVVSVGKPKKGVIYPSTLDYVPSRPTYVKTGQKEVTTAMPTTTTAESITTTPAPTTTTTTTTPAPTTTTTTTTPPSPPTTKARAAAHKIRDTGSSHPYLAHVASTSSRQSPSGQGKTPSQVFRGTSYPNRFPQRASAGLRRPEAGSAIRRPPSSPVGPGQPHLQPHTQECGSRAGPVTPMMMMMPFSLSGSALIRPIQHLSFLSG